MFVSVPFTFQFPQRSFHQNTVPLRNQLFHTKQHGYINLKVHVATFLSTSATAYLMPLCRCWLQRKFYFSSNRTMVRTRVFSVKISQEAGSVETSISMFLAGQINGHMCGRFAENVYPQYVWFWNGKHIYGE